MSISDESSDNAWCDRIFSTWLAATMFARARGISGPAGQAPVGAAVASLRNVTIGNKE
jgi:hypothetical protein